MVVKAIRRNQFLPKVWCLLSKFLNRTEIISLNNEYKKLLSETTDILENYKHSSLTDFYKISKNTVIIVLERDLHKRVCRFENIAACSKVLRCKLIDNLKATISDLMGEKFILFKDKCNIKSPGGGAFPPHQDYIAYKHFQPNFHITAAVALDTASIKNGCLEVADNYIDFVEDAETVVNTNYGIFPIFRSTKFGKEHGNICPQISALMNFKPQIMQPGDVLLFHSFLPHCSKINASTNSRRMFFFTFSPESFGDCYTAYYEKKRTEYDNPIFHISTPTSHAQLDNNNISK